MNNLQGSSVVVISGLGTVCREVANNDLLTKPNHIKDDDWFDATKYLGKRGFKYMSLATRYILAASKLSVEDANLIEDIEPENIGVIVGTNFAAFQPSKEMYKTIIADTTDALSPMTAPYSSVNIPASQVSLKWGYKAFNLTLTSPFTAGLEALIFAAESVKRGQAKNVLAGATEDQSPNKVASHFGASKNDVGACVLMLEDEQSAMDRNHTFHAKYLNGVISYCCPQINSEEAEKEEQRNNQILEVVKTAITGMGLEEIINLSFVGANDEFSSAIKQSVIRALGRLGVTASQTDYLGASGNYNTLSPVMQVGSACSEEQGYFLIVALSPLGNIVMVTIESVKTSL